MRIAPLRVADRARLSELLVATGAFNADEVEVALSLFDLSRESMNGRTAGAGSAHVAREAAGGVSAGGASATSVAVDAGSASATSVAVDAGSASATSVAVDLMDYEFLGAYDADRLMGYACFGPVPSTVGTYDLYWLAVDPAAQGRGIGRAMLGEVERLLASRGARMLVAETSGRPDYAATRAFYLATGYVEAARVRDFYAPADDRIMLHRRLTTRERGVATR